MFLVISCHAMAQTTPDNEKPPTEEELNEMISEMEKGMNALTPEERKMMEEMGVKIPNAKNMQQMAKMAANAPVASNALIPTRDASRIAALPKVALSKSSLPGYLQQVQQKITSTLSDDTKEKAEATYRGIKSKHNNSAAVANAGVGAWAFGQNAAALLLMSKACEQDPFNADHLNNYAAMLTMCDGGHLALPILQYLNKQHPKNSTILNNMAHAWFGLGETGKASQYADSTIRLCAWHPQANAIKARMLESKSNKSEAIKAHKQSISRMYSSDKEHDLKKLNYELKSNDIVWNRPLKNDALGLSVFVWPGFPTTAVSSEELEPAWNTFRKECQALYDDLESRYSAAEVAAAEAMQRNLMAMMKTQQSGGVANSIVPPMAAKAAIKLIHPTDPNSSTSIALRKRDRWLAAVESMDALRTQHGNELALFDEGYKDLFGEGKENPFEKWCSGREAIHNNFLAKANTVLETAFSEYVTALRIAINDELYFALNTESDEKYQATVLRQKLTWIGVLKSATVQFQSRDGDCKPKEERRGAAPGLPDFEDANCAYKSEMDLYFGKITSECSKLKAELSIQSVNLGWETKMSDRDGADFFDEFQRCTIEVGHSVDRTFGSGPLALEAEVGVTAFLEIDRTGISDAGVKATAEVKVKTDLLEKHAVGIKERSVNFGGVEAKISMNSGFTAGRIGMLKDL